MKKPNITPGPWEYKQNLLNGYTIKRGLGQVASTLSGNSMRERSSEEANAKAISAVPDMIDALILAHDELERWYLSRDIDPDTAWATMKVKEAIEKAGVIE